MDKVLNKPDFVQAGMLAWNHLTTVFEPQKKTVITSPEEFKEFYSLIISHLLDEETSE